MIYRIESTLLECEEQTKDEVMESVFVQQIKRMKNERNYFLTRSPTFFTYGQLRKTLKC